MKNVELLDCTLRDGGRIIDCAFSDYQITDLIKKLSDAKVNYIEIGFLRDPARKKYEGKGTFFNTVKEIEPFLRQKNGNTQYVAFVDYGMFDFDTLDPCDGKSIDGIRVGFTKKNFKEQWEDVKRCFAIVKEKGYKLFIQGVNSLAYSEKELKTVLNAVNKIQPVSFGVVDTYGAMFLKDIDHIFALVNDTLLPSIKIDLHTHNNRQMAFALAQEAIRISGDRRVIIDATLEGMGKCAGNLNLELIVDYLIQEKHYDFDFDGILDLIDEFTFSFKKTHSWGYSIPAFMGGIYKSHPNNIIYLTEKFRLGNRDIKNILSMIDEETRHTYNYDNIEKKYIEYNSMCVDDGATLEVLRRRLKGQTVLVLAPGSSLNKYKGEIDRFIQTEKPHIISVNFLSDYPNALSFFANKKRFDVISTSTPSNVIAVSNVKPSKGEMEISYDRLIDRRYRMFDNSTLMLLNLLKIVGVGKIVLAGFDGYSKRVKNNYFDNTLYNERHESEYKEINEEVGCRLKDYIATVGDHCQVSFLTPSIYQKYL